MCSKQITRAVVMLSHGKNHFEESMIFFAKISRRLFFFHGKLQHNIEINAEKLEKKSIGGY